ncbi:hypothetical protein [Deinococcus hopiensis]|uniref:Uncharacterized protein n=1 Tax=Deinococcus hopiensis KR-140 TaxID=695939 RepID=A0A1W1UQG4_9DEIO|nr:hypothetical protein [Deinococcus hopiensis]SMB83375.1 hypothetical protein SAMN00790413_04394 [Deinococcus hopiensis KR-140]
MDYFLPNAYILHTQRQPDGQTELALSREVGDVLIGSADTWKVTEDLCDTADIRVQRA